MKSRFHSFETYPYHIVGKCPEAIWPAASIDEVWRLFNEVIFDFQLGHSIQTHAFVLMSNHYHWLCTAHPDEKDPEGLFDWFHEAFTFDYVHEFLFTHILETGQSAGAIFKEAPKIIKLEHIEAYRNTYAYIYRNPVNAGIVERAEHYPYSTLPYILGRTSARLNFQCSDNMHLIADPYRTLSFINGEEPHRVHGWSWAENHEIVRKN